MVNKVFLPWARTIDMSADHGYGPFHVGGFFGIVLHVNVSEHGTGDDFFRHNPQSVCPNFQVFKSEAEGGTHQFLPLNWRPWCQSAGNQNWAAIETAGLADEPLTAYQLDAIAKICAAYHNRHGLLLQVTDSPTGRGLGTHQMGGAAWGGHSCPGPIRAAQRPAILARARQLVTPAAPTPAPPAPGPVTLTAADKTWIVEQIAAAVAHG